MQEKYRMAVPVWRKLAQGGGGAKGNNLHELTLHPRGIA